MFILSRFHTLTLDDEPSGLARQWFDALMPVIVRHPSRVSRVLLTISRDSEPTLRIALDHVLDNEDWETPMRSPFVISCVRLSYFPGSVVARQWLAAAWAGFCMHEALELVTVGGLTMRPLDPHEPPHSCDKGLRVGFPAVLTEETLRDTLALVMR